jgi:protein TonB
LIKKKMQQSMKVCLIASLSVHLCIMAVFTRYVRQCTDMRIREKPYFFVSLDSLPVTDAAPHGARQQGRSQRKKSETPKPVHTMPDPPRTETLHATTGTFPDNARTDVRKQEVLLSANSAALSASAGNRASVPSSLNDAASGTGKAETRSDTGSSGFADGKAPAGARIEDFAFGDSSGPAFLQRAPVRYPLIARRMGREGKVLLRLTMDESGKLLGVEVLKDPGCGFAESAVEAVKKSRFSPAHRNGRPVPSRVTLPVRFALEGSE